MIVILFKKKTAAGPHEFSLLDHMHQAHWTTRFTLPHILFLYYQRDVLYVTVRRATFPVAALALIIVMFADEGNQSLTDFTKIKLLTLQPLKRTGEFL
jgi:hypothetical protein